MIHTNQVREQGAAAIGYYEGLPEKKRHRYENGAPKISYEDIGILSDQPSNPNQQTAENNAYGKVLGGASPKNNGDGTYTIND